MPPDSPKTTPIFQRLDRCPRYPYSASEYARRFAWHWVHKCLIRPSPLRAYAWRRFWLARFGASVAAPSAVRPSTSVLHPWLFSLGRYSILGDRVTVYNLGPVAIGDHTVISQDTYLCAGTHDYTQPDMPLQRLPITIGHGVWICAAAFIGPGVTIGDNAVIGARSVVTSDVPPGVVVAGNPAKIIKPRPMQPPQAGG